MPAHCQLAIIICRSVIDFLFTYLPSYEGETEYIVNKYNEGDKAHWLHIIEVSLFFYSNTSIPRKGNILMLDTVYNLETLFKKPV